MKIFKTKKMILAVVTAVALSSTLPFFQSCSSNSEDVPTQESKQLEYLDMDVSNLQNLTDEQKNVLEKAKDRIAPLIIIKDNSYDLTIAKGSEIKMSEQLFEAIKSSLHQTNQMISKYNVIIDKINTNKFSPNCKSKLNENIRFKASPTENSIPPGGITKSEIFVCGYSLQLSWSSMKQLKRDLDAGTALSLYSGDELLAVSLGITSIKLDELLDKYPNGIRIAQVWPSGYIGIGLASPIIITGQ